MVVRSLCVIKECAPLFGTSAVDVVHPVLDDPVGGFAVVGEGSAGVLFPPGVHLLSRGAVLGLVAGPAPLELLLVVPLDGERSPDCDDPDEHPDDEVPEQRALDTHLLEHDVSEHDQLFSR